MKRDAVRIIIHSILISLIGVFVVDYFSHLLFSNPMETIPYFLAKATLYLIFSLFFLYFINLQKKEFVKVIISGIVIALIWGAYYNVLPLVFDYYPYGISLSGLTFLGMGLFSTGIAFGIVHTFAFIVGYYLGKPIVSRLR